MADNKSTAGGQDRTRINVHEDYEVQYWKQRFGVSAEELKAAVAAVGTQVADVEARLKKTS
jgi:hypothetical protein